MLNQYSYMTLQLSKLIMMYFPEIMQLPYNKLSFSELPFDQHKLN